jgi:hypothetical protein
MIGLLMLLGLFVGGFASGYAVRDFISRKRRDRHPQKQAYGRSGATAGHPRRAF